MRVAFSLVVMFLVVPVCAEDPVDFADPILKELVKDRVNPATRIGLKTSHFEEPMVCCEDFSKSHGFRFREVWHGKPTQNGCRERRINAERVGLVTAADRSGVGDRPGDGSSVCPFAANGGKTSHEPDPRV